jgi:hypothetical protein
MWNVPNIWQGGEVWILGGGPSVPEQFEIPSKVVNSVVSKATGPEAYSPFMSCIHHKHVIGINMAYRIGNWIDIIFFGDNGFLLANKHQLAAHPAIKVSCHPHSAVYPWIKFVDRDSRRTRGISPTRSKVSWNGNSGAAAISLAVHLGATRIILLGFDMKMNDAGVSHWHDLYDSKEMIKTKGSQVYDLAFDRHLTGFPEIARDAKKHGITILNASPNSAITDFKKVNVKDII